jgi:hypothetical protein
MDVREEPSGATGRRQRNKEQRSEAAATSWKREDIRRTLQEGFCTGDREANGRIFCQDAESEGLLIVEGSAPPKRKKRLHRVRVRNAGTPHSRLFPPAIGKSGMMVRKAPGLTGSLSGSSSGQEALKREQRGRLENEHREKPMTNHRRYKHRPRKKCNGDTPVGYSGRVTSRKEQCDVFTHC